MSMQTTTVQNLRPVREYSAHAGETEAAALHRLAAQARDRGVKIVHNLVTNHHWATSVSRPGKLHAVTLLSCDCLGFVTHGRCTHHAAILDYYCSLPPIEPVATEPDPGPDGGGAGAAPLHVNCGVIEDGAFLRRGAALGILDDRQQAALAELDRVAMAALPVPSATPVTVEADVVLSIVPARSPLDQANRTACAAYLDGDRDRAARWELTSSLMGENYFTACGLTDRALEAWCRTRLGLPTLENVCPSPMCGGRGSFGQQPDDQVERCGVCRGAGVIPGHSVNVAVFAGREVRHAA